MSEFPECLKPRAAYVDEDGTPYGMNGQRCHRIAGHDEYSNCLFDRAPEFEPPIEPTSFRTNSALYLLNQSTHLVPRLVPNPAAEA